MNYGAMAQFAIRIRICPFQVGFSAINSYQLPQFEEAKLHRISPFQMGFSAFDKLFLQSECIHLLDLKIPQQLLRIKIY